ncbi:YggS family pyridoxal phosphate-dependent enzyme [Bacillus seohaeanensis]|jgi:PLP dependent protein|uniref:Pyridoxal phosphate homeostasis protein n=1 Tax=Bacillus seohaeanensis TaxID=284580 RepID=A0ABW5RWR4_9BACI
MKVIDKLKSVKENVRIACERSGRNVDEVNIVAVTKYVSNERAQEALEAGLVHLGENRDVGLLEKRDNISQEAVWHFIGTLQSRKVKNIIHKVSYIHSLDRLSVASEINKRADKPVSCFVQVNVSGEESKHGLTPQEVKAFLEDLTKFEKVKVVGLMTMAPHSDDEEMLRSCFRKLKTLQQEIQEMALHNAPCTELSMGMSNDYMIAIEEGSTFIRIGTALVGED